MKLALPQTLRARVEPGLPAGADVRWYDGAPEAGDALAEAEVAWINVLEGPGQSRAIEAGPKLKWVTTVQAGVNTWPFQRMRERGLLFTNGAGIMAPAIAEFVVMGMLALSKNLMALMRLQAERRWAPWSTGGEELAGGRALIVGYGSIGREIGRRLEALDVEVTGVRRHPSGEPGVVGPDGWRPRLAEFDWVILAAASTSETRGIVGPAELQAMKPGARIANVARGVMLDQAALISALMEGRIGGALLDVTEPEPPAADDPIWSAPNALLTSHSSAVSDRWQGRAAALFLDNLNRYRTGQPLRNQVDLELGY
jgi:phosphoglycerate dehydrogenase-like enzyme